jgi:hypothetical protein
MSLNRPFYTYTTQLEPGNQCRLPGTGAIVLKFLKLINEVRQPLLQEKRPLETLE